MPPCNNEYIATLHALLLGISVTGLTRSEKTSVMTTPKRPGTHIWQICLADLPPQSRIDSLNTVTPNMADLLTDLPPPSIEHRCLEYHYTTLGRSTGRYSPSIEYRCLEYHYTKLGRSTGCLEYCYTKLGRSTTHQA